MKKSGNDLSEFICSLDLNKSILQNNQLQITELKIKFIKYDLINFFDSIL